MPAIIPFIPSIIGGVGAVVGGAMKDKSSQTPTYDPQSKSLRDQMFGMISRRLNGGTDLGGYTAGGQQNINHTFDVLRQSHGNDLTARGLSTSPVAGNVDATLENARGGEQARFLNSIPLLRRQLQTEDLGLADNLSQGGRGVEQASGGGAGGAFTNLAQYIGYMSGKGAFGGGNTGVTGGIKLPNQQQNPWVMYQKPQFSGWPGGMG